MHISRVSIQGYRNFAKATINMVERSLVLGANDVGKTNFLNALRLLLDRGLSDLDLDPAEHDFHIASNGDSSDTIEIIVEFANASKDAILSVFKGHISDGSTLLLKYVAKRETLSYQLFVGKDLGSMEEISSRFYLKHLSLKFVDSRRDLERYIRSEKKHLLKISQQNRTPAEITEDNRTLAKVAKSLANINQRVRKLKYVAAATAEVNAELKTLAYQHQDYSVQLDTGAIQVSEFVEKLELAGSTKGSKVMLGGDGRNNQILLALWKAKSVQEHDTEHEVVIYCVEEPEAHLHPHQQRILAKYLSEHIPGQTIVTTHSSAIVANYTPESVIRFVANVDGTRAASNGCSKFIKESWQSMGYRISILPAEAFFASTVFLVEGPSELLFYRALAKQLDIDLDYFNISILSVDGVQFDVYANILDALEIPWVARTDNDVSDIALGPNGAKYAAKNLAGLNRALSLAKQSKLLHVIGSYTALDTLTDGIWQKVSDAVKTRSIYISKVDLETDLGAALPTEVAALKGATVAEGVAYLQDKKATRMAEFIGANLAAMKNLHSDDLALPLLRSVEIAQAKATA